MPKHKKNDTSDSDSGPDDVGPAKKNVKTESKSSSKGGDDTSWSLGKNRFLKLTEFKNSWYIDIREFYNADGDLKPGRKGIMLTMDQWQKMKGFMDEIDEAIKKHV